MKLNLTEISKGLSKAYLKQDLNREQIDLFKINLKILFSRTEAAEREGEHEEHFKNIVSDFLKDTYYKNDYDINTSDRKDLVIHNGKSSSDSVGVIIEAKRPSNEAEMITPNNPNAKALHELFHYYMHERFVKNNKEIKHIIATNSFEWYIFDATIFERIFYDNKTIRKSYEDWNNGFLVGLNVGWFYKEIARPYIEKEVQELEAVHFNLLDFKNVIENSKIEEDYNFINLYKILSPEHLLKKPFANDSNSLNKAFYNELLHIIGLEEIPDTGKKVIARKEIGRRDDASLLENTINKLKVDNCLSRFNNAEQLGDSEEDQLYNIALELCITWLNRILFLKLLEGQLITYHNGNKGYHFVNKDIIGDFDILNELFFEVLAVNYKDRSKTVIDKFGSIPYLNSSLFEKSEIENKAFQISNIKGRLELPLYPHSILRNKEENKYVEKRNTLHYLFEFLSAYNFASDSSAKIQEDNKTIINASVLGLIFEKINGYKDGSFFTPGFITMYMCRETIRRKVASKFAELEKPDIASFEDVKNYCSRFFKRDDILRLNAHIDSIRICDPAVGSGHFLVSALNELIAIKSELNILIDAEGTPLEYDISVDNDELTIIDRKNNKPFEYLLGANNKPPKALQKVQVALFAEKQKIIENCLFGVDVNPKSVLICRLRLWIELLKNAYYKADSYTELETLPNIDINIKCGNSLISRYGFDSSIKSALKKNKWTIESYRSAIMTYRNARNKSEKQEMTRLISQIKSDFTVQIILGDKNVIALEKARGELHNLTLQTSLFSLSAKDKQLWTFNVQKKTQLVHKLEKKIEDIKNNVIYQKAFEWRFEFPEVLNSDGDFEGFDMVIGNPPYIGQKHSNALFQEVKQTELGEYHQRRMDYFYFFFHAALNIAKPSGIVAFITTNYYLTATYADKLRKDIRSRATLQVLLNFNELKIFESALGQHNIITVMSKGYNPNVNVNCCFVTQKGFATSFILQSLLNNSNDNIVKSFPKNSDIYEGDSLYIRMQMSIMAKISGGSIFDKIMDKSQPLWKIFEPIEGIHTGADKLSASHLKSFDIKLPQGTGIYVLSKDEINKMHLNSEERSLIKPWFKNSDIHRWITGLHSDKYLIYYTSKGNYNSVNNIRKHLKQFKPILINRKTRSGTGIISVEDYDEFVSGKKVISYVMNASAFKRGDYYCVAYPREQHVFEGPKIVVAQRSPRNAFAYNERSWYASADVYFIITKEDKYDLKYLLGLLNSELFYYWLYHKGKRKGETLELYIRPLSEIPIKHCLPSEQKPIIGLVERILAEKAKNKEADVKYLEHKLNTIVYDLYDLTPSERAVVQGSIK